MNLESLMELFVHELKDLYSAETQLVKAIPDLAKACSDGELRALLEELIEEAAGQARRLERILLDLGASPGGITCQGMAGILEEGRQLLSGTTEPEVRDAAILGAAQRAEHYEIAGYGTVRAFARRLGRHPVAELLQQTLDEEAMADEKFTDLAERKINELALHGGNGFP
jgi:ferritin-like metal-binding protein YciE